MYHSLIHPYIFYAKETWFCAPKYLTNKICVLQKKSIRVIYNLPYNSHSSPYFELSNIITVPYFYKRNVLIYMLNLHASPRGSKKCAQILQLCFNSNLCIIDLYWEINSVCSRSHCNVFIF